MTLHVLKCILKVSNMILVARNHFRVSQSHSHVHTDNECINYVVKTIHDQMPGQHLCARYTYCPPHGNTNNSTERNSHISASSGRKLILHAQTKHCSRNLTQKNAFCKLSHFIFHFEFICSRFAFVV